MQSCLTAEISASAVRANLTLLRSLLKDSTKICAVVKANCYGHGLDLLLEVICEQAQWLAVATGPEALHLRRLGYEGSLLVTLPGGGLHGALDELISAGATLTLSSLAQVAATAEAAADAGRTAEVHVKVDTGMSRGGAAANLVPDIVRNVRASNAMKLTGLYTHFADADAADKTSAERQFDCFMDVVGACGGRDELVLHAANSAAVIDMPQTHLDMVRPGLAIYGYQSSEEMHNRPELRPALRLVGRVTQIKDVPSGASCGYGLTYTFDRPSRLALVPVGYADGYLRYFSNRAAMYVGGGYAPVRGRVSMDQTILDVTDIPTVAVGDEVEIISRDASQPHSVENLAQLARTIPYEITCLLGERIRRVAVE